MNDIFYPVVHRPQAEIEALKKRYETFDERVIPDVMKAAGYTSVSWVRPTTYGTTHVVYIVTVCEQKTPLILRANIGWGEPEGVLLIEKIITDSVIPLGIPVNKILFADISRKQFPFDYQIQEVLEGTDIEDTFHGTREEYDILSFNLGKYIATWGELTFDGFGRFDIDSAKVGKLIGTKASMYDYIIVQLDNDLRYLVDGHVLDVKKADRIRQIFDEYKDVTMVKKGTLVQYDLADHNIMFASNRITGIFDWEAAVVGDPVLDLASSPTWRTHYPREEKLIAGYQSVRDLPEYFTEKMNIYRLRTMVWKMVYAIRAGILNEDRKKRFYAALAPFGL